MYSDISSETKRKFKIFRIITDIVVSVFFEYMC
jgi:hypothetical protein